MKILIYSQNFAPEVTGTGKYTGEMARWLGDRGHEVTVICSAPYYPLWKTAPGYKAYRYYKEQHANLLVLRCPLWVPTTQGLLNRILHLGSFALSSLPVAIKHMFRKPDVVLCVEPSFAYVPQALILSKLFRVKSWLHIQDFEFDMAFATGFFSSGLMKKMLASIELACMNAFDHISSITPAMLRVLVEKKVTNTHSSLFPNWIDVSVIKPLAEPVKARASLSLDTSKTIFLYSGNIGEKQGIDIIIDAARALQSNNEIMFVLCGSGSSVNRHKQQSADLPNLSWLPLQPEAKLNLLLNCADVHLLPQREDTADLAMPSKLTGMFASGRPVIATTRAGTQLYTSVEECGLCVPPGNLDAFVSAILELHLDIEKRKLLGINARAYAVAHMNRDAILEDFEQSLKTLMAQE